MTHNEKYEAYCIMDEETLLAVWEQAKAMYESTVYFMALEKYMAPEELTDAEETEWDEAVESKYMAQYDEAKETKRDVETAMRVKDMDDLIDEYDETDPYARMCEKARNTAKAITKPFWELRGAQSEEELLAYTDYCQKLDDEAYVKFVEEHPDEDPEGAYEVDLPTIEEWRAMNK